MGEPLVSIVIPTYNRSALLRSSLESLISQNYPAKEIIVVDDGSTDETETICGQYPVGYFRQEKGGVSAALNLGVDRCQGELLVFLDDDDLCPPDSLALRVTRLQADTAFHHVVGRLRRFRAETDGQIEFMDPEDPPYNFNHLGAGVLRRTAFEKVGGFNETLRMSEDVDLWMRLREAGMRHKPIPEVCLFYRRHSDNCTHDIDNSQKEFLSVLHRGMHRRRTEQT